VNNAIQPLQKGDLIYITAPAKSVEEEFVINAKTFLEEKGFRVMVSEHCLGQFNYFSGTDEERLADFQFGIDHPDVKAILCARGGYGCIRILDRINWAGFLREPKWLIGFSDVTVFHQRLQRFDLPSIHGTMPLNFKDNSKEALQTLVDALLDKDYSISCPPTPYNKNGHATGKLVGGNLSILYSLLGTDDEIDFSNTILFIEDLAEHLYHIDRMLYAFSKAGVFNKIKALVIGGMTDMKDTAVPFGQTLEELILAHFTYRSIPIAFNFPAGHIDDNRALKLGTICDLEVSEEKTRLTFTH
jgi:muramoyltetrapeptide carboxypeptidase